ncbi:MAG TPA: hypothetical protein DEA08_05870 [Planctomycetes bacterium]|nr:hypothetical protein [Planctomycetota bacterium]
MNLAVSLLLALLLYALARGVFALGERAFRHERLAPWRETLKPLATPAKACLVFLLVLLWGRVAASQAAAVEWLDYYAGALLRISLAWLVIRGANVVVLGIHYQRTKGAPLPAVFRAIVNGTIYVLLGLVVLHRVYGIAVGDLVFWGAALAVVLGIALQSVLWSLFAGLVIYYQDAFRVGDAIRIGEVEGRVEEIEWRTTTLLAPEGHRITIPNWTVSQATLINRHRPTRTHRLRLELEANGQFPPTPVAGLLERIASEVPGVVSEPAPAARLRASGAAHRFELECVAADHDQRLGVEDALRRRAWYALRRAGWSWPPLPPAVEPDPRLVAALAERGLEHDPATLRVEPWERGERVPGQQRLLVLSGVLERGEERYHPGDVIAPGDPCLVSADAELAPLSAGEDESS